MSSKLKSVLATVLSIVLVLNLAHLLVGTSVVRADDYVVYNGIYCFDDGYVFYYDDEYLPSNGVVEIPEYIEGIEVVGIDSGAFSETSVVEVIIPETVTEIGSSAFQKCEQLESITIPDSVTLIDSSAFADCISLRNIDLPDSINSIVGNCFKNSGLVSITIPSFVTSIGNGAFSGCESLTNVVLPDSLESIEYDCFKGSGLVSITIPSSVNSIGYDAFNGCSSLQEVVCLSDSIQFGDSVFLGCSDLTLVFPCSASETFQAFNTDGFTLEPFHSNCGTWLNGSYVCENFPETELDPSFDANCVGHSLFIDSYIGVDFYFQLSDSITTNPDAYISVSGPSNEPVSYSISRLTPITVVINSQEVDVYMVTGYVAAKEMGDIVTASVVVPYAGGEWRSTVEEYSVEQYCGNYRDTDANPGFDSKIDKALQSMLIYGACAQEYFGYNTEALVYTLESNPNGIPTLIDGVLNGFEGEIADQFNRYAEYITVQGPEDGVQLVASNLVLGSTTSMRLYFSVPTELADATITYTVNDVSYEPTVAGNRVYITVDNIPPINIVAGYPIVVTVDGVDQLPMAFSPAAYCNLVSNTEGVDANLQHLVRAMFMFGSYVYSAFKINT